MKLPRVCPPSSDDRFFWRRYSRIAVNPFKDCDATTYDDVIRDVLHDGSGFTGHQSQQDRSLVQVPEKKELTPEMKAVLLQFFGNITIF